MEIVCEPVWHKRTAISRAFTTAPCATMWKHPRPTMPPHNATNAPTGAHRHAGPSCRIGTARWRSGSPTPCPQASRPTCLCGRCALLARCVACDVLSASVVCVSADGFDPMRALQVFAQYEEYLSTLEQYQTRQWRSRLVPTTCRLTLEEVTSSCTRACIGSRGTVSGARAAGTRCSC